MAHVGEYSSPMEHMGYDFPLEVSKWDLLTNDTMAPPFSHTSLAWFITRDPYFMIYEIIPTYLGSISSPIYKQPGFFFIAQMLETHLHGRLDQ